jgi:uncharacterized delta-60 repeat protein
LFGLLGVLLVPFVVRAGDSNLDPTFGTFGITTTAIGYPDDVGIAGALQSDGKLVVVGVSHDNTLVASDVAVVRLLSNGQLDPSFGSGGKVTTDVTFGDQGSAVAIQSDGKIVVAGNTDDGSLLQFLVARYLPNGSPDGAFGVGGVALTDIGGERAQAEAVLLDPDGRIVVAGSAVIGGDYKIAVARYEDDGSLDESFGMGGIVVTDVAGEGVANGIVRQNDGKLVVAGTRYGNLSFNTSDVVLVRYTDTGSADGAFGAGGIVTRDLGPGIDDGEAVLLQPDGKLVVSGTHYTGDQSTNSAATLLRFLPSGSPDGAFGVAGAVITDLTPGHEAGEGVTRLPDGRYVVVGESGPLPLSNQGLDWLVLRYNANGSLDPTFGTGGHLTLGIGAPGNSNDFAHDVLRQPDGKIVVFGSGFNVDGDPGRIAVARFGGTCGNGVLNPGEECDDGNATNGDCCSIGCQAEPAGGACLNNNSLCKASQCDGAGHCGRPLAASGCKLPTVPLKSQLQFKDKTPDKGDLAVWKWMKGAATSLTDYGDPTSTTSYALCVYQGSSATGALLFETDAPAGGTCHNRPCWKALNGKGFKYADRDATPNGDIANQLKTGDAGKAHALVRGKGVDLNLPALPLPLPVRAQLRASNGMCWEADFSSAGVKANDTTQFNGKSD